VGIMLPYTPPHFRLFGDGRDAPPEFSALVITSGNISDEPIVTANEEAWRVADCFLFHNRESTCAWMILWLACLEGSHKSSGVHAGMRRNPSISAEL
jgi:hypothetical protein